MFNINDYYLGLILASPDYFINKKAQNRANSYPDADPFNNLTREQAMVTGSVVILRRENDNYFDEDYSLFRNELSYHLNKQNRYGITLAYVKPFSDFYCEKPHIYNQEDFIKNENLMNEAIDRSYYVMHYSHSDSYAIIINDQSYYEGIQYEYFRDLLGPEEFDHMITKKNSQKKK